MKTAALMIVGVFLCLQGASADTEISGDVSGRWILDDSPYIATGNLRLPQGERLEIEPGVTVRFERSVSFFVHGLLLAVGTEEDSIRFTWHRQNERWRGVRMVNADHNSRISYCVIEYAETIGNFDNVDGRGAGLFIDGCNALISHNTVRRNHTSGRTSGIHAQNCNPIIEHNLVTENTGFTAGSLLVDNSRGIVRYNLVTRNQTLDGGGIFSYRGAPLIEHNIIINNSSTRMRWGCGLYFAHNSQATARYNLIANNDGGGVYAGAGCQIDNFIFNTIVDNPGRSGVLIYQNSHINMVNCILRGHDDEIWLVDGQFSASYSNIHNLGQEQFNRGEGLIDEDPLFVDPDNGNYRLSRNSPCINAGDPAGPRDPDGSRADMGCFPYGAPINLVLQPAELNLGYVSPDRAAAEEFTITYEAEDDDADIVLQLAVPNGDGWLSVSPDEVALRPQDVEVIEVTARIPEQFEWGLHQSFVSIIFEELDVEVAQVPVEAFAVPGFGELAGSVTDAQTGEPVPGLAVRLTPLIYEAQTDAEGEFRFESLPAWEYRLAVDDEEWLPFQSEPFEIAAGEALEMEIELLFAACEVNPQELSLDLLPDEEVQGEIAVHNPGSGTLEFSASLVFPGQDRFEPWEQAFEIAAADMCGDDRLQGVEFAEGRFFISGGNNGEGRGLLHIFTADGEYEGSFPQFSNSNWGLRDLTWDGELLWGGDEREIFGFTTGGELVHRFNGPFGGATLNRALAWDPVRELFWVTDVQADLVAMSREGEVISRRQRRDDQHIYGLSHWEGAEDGFDLFAFCKDGEREARVIKINPESGEWRIVAELQPADGLKAGGLTITRSWLPGAWTCAGVLQGREGVTDRLGVWYMEPFTGWVTAGGEAGQLRAGESIDVPYALNSAGLSAGTELEAMLRFEHNGRGGALDVPISLTVGGMEAVRRITLTPRWSLASLNVRPANPTVVGLTRPLVEAGWLIFVKNHLGRFYWPARNFDNIGEWLEGSGYYMRVSQACQWRVEGEPIEPDTPIQLNLGWQAIAYYPRAPVAAPLALRGIWAQVEIVKDSWGDFYLPRLNFGNMAPMREGEGYLLKMREAAELVYQWEFNNAGTEVQVGRNSDKGPRYLTKPQPTGENMSLLVWADVRLEGDVAAYCDDRLAGAGRLVDGACGLAVWGDDPTTEAKDGARIGELLELRLVTSDGWVKPVVLTEEGEPTYQPDELWVARLIEEPLPPAVYGLKSAYPNPFNRSTVIRFTTVDMAEVELALYDVSGRLAWREKRVGLQAGDHQATVSGESLTSGIYILKLTSGRRVAKMKLVMVK